MKLETVLPIANTQKAETTNLMLSLDKFGVFFYTILLHFYCLQSPEAKISLTQGFYILEVFLIIQTYQLT